MTKGGDAQGDDMAVAENRHGGYPKWSWRREKRRLVFNAAGR